MNALWVVLALVMAFLTGRFSAALAIHNAVFHPWLDSLKPGDPDFLVRSRDYGAAWNAALRAERFPYPRACFGPYNSFADAPGHPRRTEAA